MYVRTSTNPVVIIVKGVQLSSSVIVDSLYLVRLHTCTLVMHRYRYQYRYRCYFGGIGLVSVRLQMPDIN